MEAGLACLAAALLLIIFYVFAFRWIHPEFTPFMDRDATKLATPAKNLVPVSVGRYAVDGNRAIIEDFSGDEAILALPHTFQAEDYPFIKVNLQGFTRYSKFKVLWRQANKPSQTHALEFNRSGEGATQIAMAYGGENYQGEIADIALLFFDGPDAGFENNNDVAISISSIEFRPFSAFYVAVQIFEDWTNPPLLQGYSNNVVKGIHAHGMIFPNAAANLMTLTAVALIFTLRLVRKYKGSSSTPAELHTTVLFICLYAWAFNDALRWHARLEHIIDTHDRYAGLSLENGFGITLFAVRGSPRTARLSYSRISKR